MRNALSPRALLGTSPAILQLQADARLAQACDAQVLLTGERGVGKRALAVLIHSRSERQRRAFRSVAAAGVADSELEPKLFGEVAPSAPPRSRPGILHAARKGTLFINGIDQIGPRLQTRLSRFLETDEVRPVGADSPWEVVDVRIIVGAPPDLFEHVTTGEFREELYYRLNVIHIMVPALRERIEDVPTLLRDCLACFAKRRGIDPPELSADAEEKLMAYSWPGNVNELEQLTRWLVRRSRGAVITAAELPRKIANNRR